MFRVGGNLERVLHLRGERDQLPRPQRGGAEAHRGPAEAAGGRGPQVGGGCVSEKEFH